MNRVLVVAWWYPAPGRPMLGLFVRDHARAAARDHDVTVLAFEPARDLGRRPFAIVAGEEHGMRTVRVRHALGAAGAVPGMAAAVARVARPQVVHAHVYMAGLLAAPFARAWRAPLVLSEHFSGFQLGTLGRAERVAARAALRAAAVVCPPSAALRRALEPYAPRARFRVVPNPVDTDRFHPPASRPGGGPLLFVGNLEEVKGVPELLHAFAAVHAERPSAMLELIGGGPARPRYEALAQHLGVAGAVQFRGVLDREEVAAAMRRAAALVAPSRTETFGTAVAEALASGLPVVGTRVGALPELVDDGLVPPGDDHALAAAMERALDGRLAAPPAGASRCSFDAVADAWRDVYAEATARSRRGT